MNAIKQLQTALDDYNDDELIRIIEDSGLDNVRYLRDLAQEAIYTAEGYKDRVERLEDQ